MSQSWKGLLYFGVFLFCGNTEKPPSKPARSRDPSPRVTTQRATPASPRTSAAPRASDGRPIPVSTISVFLKEINSCCV